MSEFGNFSQNFTVKFAKKMTSTDSNLGSFILAYIGIGAAHATSGLLGYSGSSTTHGALAGGFGVALGIFFSAGASGGHLNPSVTMAHFILGKEWSA
jgi:glycerol uptake facilitator-like aquaporin